MVHGKVAHHHIRMIVLALFIEILNEFEERVRIIGSLEHMVEEEAVKNIKSTNHIYLVPSHVRKLYFHSSHYPKSTRLYP